MASLDEGSSSKDASLSWNEKAIAFLDGHASRKDGGPSSKDPSLSGNAEDVAFPDTVASPKDILVIWDEEDEQTEHEEEEAVASRTVAGAGGVRLTPAKSSETGEVLSSIRRGR